MGGETTKIPDFISIFQWRKARSLLPFLKYMYLLNFSSPYPSMVL